MFFIVLGSLITLLICMAFGYICRRRGIINDEINAGLSKILVRVTLPCTVIVSMQKPFDASLLLDCAIVLVVSTVVYFFGTFVALACCKIFKAKVDEKGVWLFGLTLPNIVYMGFPVIGSIYGHDSLFYVSIANISFNVIAFSFGIKLITLGYESSEINLKSLLTNIAILATFVGFIFFIFSVSLPKPIYDGLSMVGGMTTPISMMIIGSILAKSKFRETLLEYRIYIISFCRLIIIPIVVCFILKQFIANKMLLGVLVMLAGMPCATITAIFAEQYGGNSILGSKVVFVSTVLSMFTIPLISLLIE